MYLDKIYIGVTLNTIVICRPTRQFYGFKKWQSTSINNNNNNNNNNNVYLIKRPYYQEPFKGVVQIICNIIIPQIMSVKNL